MPDVHGRRGWASSSAPVTGAPSGPRARGGVVVCVGDRLARARVTEALRGIARLTFVDAPAEVCGALAAGLGDAVLIDPAQVEGSATLGHLNARLRDEFPTVPLVAYCDLRQMASSQTRFSALLQAGVHQIVIRGVDDVRSVLVAALDMARHERVIDRVLADAGPYLPRLIVPIVRFFLERGPTGGASVEEAADSVGKHRRTVATRLATAGLPPASAIAGWCRILFAARALENPGRPIERIAVDLGFTSGSALRNMLKHYTGLTPAELRSAGGFDHLCGLFVQALRDGTAPAIEVHDDREMEGTEPADVSRGPVGPPEPAASDRRGSVAPGSIARGVRPLHVA